jgi:hypothetical protein
MAQKAFFCKTVELINIFTIIPKIHLSTLNSLVLDEAREKFTSKTRFIIKLLVLQKVLWNQNQMVVRYFIFKICNS